jgi:hypothetical protein
MMLGDRLSCIADDDSVTRDFLSLFRGSHWFKCSPNFARTVEDVHAQIARDKLLRFCRLPHPSCWIEWPVNDGLLAGVSFTSMGDEGILMWPGVASRPSGKQGGHPA